MSAAPSVPGGPLARLAARWRHVVRSRPLLYRGYLRLVGRHQDSVFPGPDTDLHLTGFPRSANTYAMRLVEYAAPDLRTSTHIHAIASLRLALAHSVPTLVLFRDPLSAVASGLVRAGVPAGAPGPTARWLSDYIVYHRFVIEHLDRIHLLPFEFATQRPDVLLRTVEALCPGSLRVKPEEGEAASRQVLEQMRERNISRDASRSSVPNAEKAARKEAQREAIRRWPSYPEAAALYDAMRIAFEERGS